MQEGSPFKGNNFDDMEGGAEILETLSSLYLNYCSTSTKTEKRRIYYIFYYFLTPSFT